MTSYLVWWLNHQFQIAFKGEQFQKSKIHLIASVKLGLKKVYANFVGDWTKFVDCENFRLFHKIQYGGKSSLAEIYFIGCTKPGLTQGIQQCLVFQKIGHVVQK